MTLETIDLKIRDLDEVRVEVRDSHIEPRAISNGIVQGDVIEWLMGGEAWSKGLPLRVAPGGKVICRRRTKAYAIEYLPTGRVVASGLVVKAEGEARVVALGMLDELAPRLRQIVHLMERSAELMFGAEERAEGVRG